MITMNIESPSWSLELLVAQKKEPNQSVKEDVDNEIISSRKMCGCSKGDTFEVAKNISASISSATNA